MNPGTLVKEGWIFTGWNTTENGSGTAYSAGDSFTMGSSDLSFFAQWGGAIRNITFNPQGGTGNGETQRIRAYSKSTLTKNSFTRPGYAYSGWNTRADGTGTGYADEGEITMPDSDMVLYAQWGPVTNTVFFNANGGTGTVEDLFVPTDSFGPLRENAFLRDGYEFTSWNTKADGTGTGYVAGTLIPMGPASPTLYAQWAAKAAPVTISFDPNTGTGSMAPLVKNSGDSITLPANTLTRTGYTFAGWNIQADGLGAGYADKATYLIPAASQTLYAQWKVNSYKLHFFDFYYGGATGSMASLDLEYNQTITLPPCGFTKEGYTFLGWTALDSGKVDYAPGAAFTQGLKSIQLGALWSPNSGTALWARSTTAGTSSSFFIKVAADKDGNYYAVGSQTAPASYRNGVTTSYPNGVLVKYNAAGQALWSRAVDEVGLGATNCQFRGVTVDPAGNIYVVGHIQGKIYYRFGQAGIWGATVNENALIVKYNSEGVVQWARTALAGTGSETTTSSSQFNAVAVDAQGNIYAAGVQYSKGYSSWGTGIGLSTANGHTFHNGLLVKFNSSGTALWAKGPVSGAGSTSFKGVAVDGSGLVYLAGEQQGGNIAVSWNEDTLTTSSNSAEASGLMAQFTAAGTVNWVKVATGGTRSSFTSLAVSASGDIYAGGYQTTDSVYTYGTGVFASAAGQGIEPRYLLVQYSSSGAAVWVRAVGKSATGMASVDSVTIGENGMVYTAGRQYGTDYNYSGVVVASAYSGNNGVVIKWTPEGQALWGKSTSTGSNASGFGGAAADSQGNLVVVGSQNLSGGYTYGPEVSVSGSASASNALIIKYRQ